MTFLVERLAELHRHLDHLEELRPRVGGWQDLERNLSLHNDVLFSLLTVCQLVVDVAGELAARRGDRFEDYTEAVRSLAHDARFPAELVEELDAAAGLSERGRPRVRGPRPPAGRRGPRWPRPRQALRSNRPLSRDGGRDGRRTLTDLPVRT